jgi:hypothetical protein
MGFLQTRSKPPRSGGLGWDPWVVDGREGGIRDRMGYGGVGSNVSLGVALPPLPSCVAVFLSDYFFNPPIRNGDSKQNSIRFELFRKPEIDSNLRFEDFRTTRK